MTGEIFNLLREHSILADLLAGEQRPTMPLQRAFAADFRTTA